MGDSLLSRLGSFTLDYLFATKTVKDYKSIEREIRELYPKRDEDTIDIKLDSLTLEGAIPKIRMDQRVSGFCHPLFTIYAGVGIPASYFVGAFDLKGSLAMLGAMVIAKSSLYFFDRKDVKDRKEIVASFKRELYEDLGDEGEEWK